tara:strand:+ start:475 stop:978 length:504 start_codon:yes stop_codon:yes gene_type:complete
MALGNQFKSAELDGSGFTATYTSEQYPVGTVALQPADEVSAANATHTGDRVWVFVKANVELTVNEVVSRVVGTAAFLGTEGVVANTYSEVLGVADHTIAAASYGWIIRRGCCEVLADGSATQGVDQMCVASGRVSDMTAGLEARVIGSALDTDAGAGTLITMWLQLA